ncbi:putative fibroblast growth factor 1 [Oryzias melastigma]|uniref:Fibroblast growth factor n=1 Tax=Oryzias melastigma TaxID=30732 RepID=A0A3B3BKF8_ORYME|nr:putative fibroblast growth factor 1 [Oryzias melastigma]
MEYDVVAGARFSISARSRSEQAPLLPSVKPPHAVSRSRLFLSSMADAEAAEMTAVRGQSPGGGPPLLDYRRLTRLYCRNGGHHLQIPPDGTVRGERDERDAHIVLKLKAVDRGVVIIQGTESQRYLAMNDEGRLYSSPTVTDECYFLEKLEENFYNTYRPQKYQDSNWFVGLKKNGKPKLGPRTHIGQKAVFFIPRQLEED